MSAPILRAMALYWVPSASQSCTRRGWRLSMMRPVSPRSARVIRILGIGPEGEDIERLAGGVDTEGFEFGVLVDVLDDEGLAVVKQVGEDGLIHAQVAYLLKRLGRCASAGLDLNPGIVVHQADDAHGSVLQRLEGGGQVAQHLIFVGDATQGTGDIVEGMQVAELALDLLVPLADKEGYAAGHVGDDHEYGGDHEDVESVGCGAGDLVVVVRPPVALDVGD